MLHEILGSRKNLVKRKINETLKNRPKTLNKIKVILKSVSLRFLRPKNNVIIIKELCLVESFSKTYYNRKTEYTTKFTAD